MKAIIDLDSELLIDCSRIGDPHLRLLLAAIGRRLAKGSAWVTVNKELAAYYGLLSQFFVPRRNVAAA